MSTRIAQIDELRKLRAQMDEASNYATVWLSRSAELQDKILRLRLAVCGREGNERHQWEIDHTGNEICAPNSRAFCEICGKVKFL